MQSSPVPEKLALFLEYLRCAWPKLAIAFSGGLDSRFLARAARVAGCQVVLLHAAGPHIPVQDSDFARRWAGRQALELEIVLVNPLDLPEVRANGRQRCYACKKAMLAAMLERLGSRSEGGWPLAVGTQTDDLSGFRPGNAAAEELGVMAPLALAGLAKQDLRRLGGAIGLDALEQQARPCLLTRLAYGMRPEAEILAAIGACERDLGLLATSNTEYRLRLRPEPLLQWSGPVEGIREAALAILEKYGFLDAAIEENALISGYFDRACHERS